MSISRKPKNPGRLAPALTVEYSVSYMYCYKLVLFIRYITTMWYTLHKNLKKKMYNFIPSPSLSLVFLYTY